MSKHQKNNNTLTVSSDDDDEAATQLLPTPGPMVPVMEPTAGANVAPAADGAAELPHQLHPDDPWRRVETQLSALTTALLHLVAVVTPITTGGGPVVDHPGVNEQRAGDGTSECPPLVEMAAIPGRVETAAISQSLVTMRLPAANLDIATAWWVTKYRNTYCEGECRSEKKTLKEVFAKMAEVYEPPDDRTRKFQHRRRGSSESPLAYRSALMVLAVDAYPDVKQEFLDPLVIERMLALARDMGVVLPTCGHESQTSLWATRSLNAHEKLKRWAQMATWAGDPARDGQPIGWSPSKVVVIPEEVPSEGDVAAAVPPWNHRRRDGRRRQSIYRPRRDGDLLHQQPPITCCRCGCVGHYSRECRARPASPSGLPTTSPAADRLPSLPSTQATPMSEASGPADDPVLPCPPALDPAVPPPPDPLLPAAGASASIPAQADGLATRTRSKTLHFS
ncbi:unnamed protein product [Lampetra fluviatilis]